jgi:hypothetical protein
MDPSGNIEKIFHNISYANRLALCRMSNDGLMARVDAEITAHVWVGSKARWDRLNWAIP